MRACGEASPGLISIRGVPIGKKTEKGADRPEFRCFADGEPNINEDVTSNDKYVVAALRCDTEPSGHGGGAPDPGYKARHMRPVL